MFSPVSVHQELAEKQKPPTHQGGGFSPPAEILFSEFPHHTSSGTSVPDQGHLSSPQPGCQTRLRVVPDAGADHIEFASARNKILCHSRRTGLRLPVPRITGKSSLTVLAKPDGVGAGSQRWIATGEQSLSRTRIVATESVSLFVQMKS